ncbi:hypothetical protein CYMTET_53160 [Cymbomonas tetramitiformis]|uniref:Uncharacterized protein n=1 Tax=Cymbomonas tetramitiformis TaxID=36881 RepID=A0AAE0BIM8_9CHLO|nr:hypothetical protein CYMTET_53160 [Cymbomonas tetramitiformis]
MFTSTAEANVNTKGGNDTEQYVVEKFKPSGGCGNVPITMQHAGRVELGGAATGRLAMRVVECDGGQHSNEHAPSNVLRNDGTVYCTSRGRDVNIVLEAADSKPFDLAEIRLVAPQSGYTSPLGRGLVFLSTEPPEVVATERYDGLSAAELHSAATAGHASLTAAALAGKQPSACHPFAAFDMQGTVFEWKEEVAPPQRVRYIHIKMVAPRRWCTSANIDISCVEVYGRQDNTVQQAALSAAAVREGAFFTNGRYLGVLLHPRVATEMHGQGKLFTMRGFSLEDGALLGDSDAGLAPLQQAFLEGKPPSDMRQETHRLATFGAWPHMEYPMAVPSSCAPPLAPAFQVGRGFPARTRGVCGDRCLCFCCNVALVSWVPQDDPWQEHMRHTSSCTFVAAHRARAQPPPSDLRLRVCLDPVNAVLWASAPGSWMVTTWHSPSSALHDPSASEAVLAAEAATLPPEPDNVVDMPRMALFLLAHLDRLAVQQLEVSSSHEAAECQEEVKVGAEARRRSLPPLLEPFCLHVHRQPLRLLLSLLWQLCQRLALGGNPEAEDTEPFRVANGLNGARSRDRYYVTALLRVLRANLGRMVLLRLPATVLQEPGCPPSSDPGPAAASSGGSTPHIQSGGSGEAAYSTPPLLQESRTLLLGLAGVLHGTEAAGCPPSRPEGTAVAAAASAPAKDFLGADRSAWRQDFGTWRAGGEVRQEAVETLVAGLPVLLPDHAQQAVLLQECLVRLGGRQGSLPEQPPCGAHPNVSTTPPRKPGGEESDKSSACRQATAAEGCADAAADATYLLERLVQRLARRPGLLRAMWESPAPLVGPLVGLMADARTPGMVPQLLQLLVLHTHAAIHDAVAGRLPEAAPGVPRHVLELLHALHKSLLTEKSAPSQAPECRRAEHEAPWHITRLLSLGRDVLGACEEVVRRAVRCWPRAGTGASLDGTAQERHNVQAVARARLLEQLHEGLLGSLLPPLALSLALHAHTSAAPAVLLPAVLRLLHQLRCLVRLAGSPVGWWATSGGVLSVRQRHFPTVTGGPLPIRARAWLVEVEPAREWQAEGAGPSGCVWTVGWFAPVAAAEEAVQGSTTAGKVAPGALGEWLPRLQYTLAALGGRLGAHLVQGLEAVTPPELRAERLLQGCLQLRAPARAGDSAEARAEAPGDTAVDALLGEIRSVEAEVCGVEDSAGAASAGGEEAVEARGGSRVQSAERLAQWAFLQELVHGAEESSARQLDAALQPRQPIGSPGRHVVQGDVSIRLIERAFLAALLACTGLAGVAMRASQALQMPAGNAGDDADAGHSAEHPAILEEAWGRGAELRQWLVWDRQRQAAQGGEKEGTREQVAAQLQKAKLVLEWELARQAEEGGGLGAYQQEAAQGVSSRGDARASGDGGEGRSVGAAAEMLRAVVQDAVVSADALKLAAARQGLRARQRTAGVHALRLLLRSSMGADAQLPVLHFIGQALRGAPLTIEPPAEHPGQPRAASDAAPSGIFIWDRDVFTGELARHGDNPVFTADGASRSRAPHAHTSQEPGRHEGGGSAASSAASEGACGPHYSAHVALAPRRSEAAVCRAVHLLYADVAQVLTSPASEAAAQVHALDALAVRWAGGADEEFLLKKLGLLRSLQDVLAERAEPRGGGGGGQAGGSGASVGHDSAARQNAVNAAISAAAAAAAVGSGLLAEQLARSSANDEGQGAGRGGNVGPAVGGKEHGAAGTAADDGVESVRVAAGMLLRVLTAHSFDRVTVVGGPRASPPPTMSGLSNFQSEALRCQLAVLERCAQGLRAASSQEQPPRPPNGAQGTGTREGSGAASAAKVASSSLAQPASASAGHSFYSDSASAGQAAGCSDSRAAAGTPSSASVSLPRALHRAPRGGRAQLCAVLLGGLHALAGAHAEAAKSLAEPGCVALLLTILERAPLHLQRRVLRLLRRVLSTIPAPAARMLVGVLLPPLAGAARDLAGMRGGGGWPGGGMRGGSESVMLLRELLARPAPAEAVGAVLEDAVLAVMREGVRAADFGRTLSAWGTTTDDLGGGKGSVELMSALRAGLQLAEGGGATSPESAGRVRCMQWRVVAALAVVGGLAEHLRVGARVVIDTFSAGGGASIGMHRGNTRSVRRGVVVGYSESCPATVRVLLEPGVSGAVPSVSAIRQVPAAAVRVEAEVGSRLGCLSFAATFAPFVSFLLSSAPDRPAESEQSAGASMHSLMRTMALQALPGIIKAEGGSAVVLGPLLPLLVRHAMRGYSPAAALAGASSESAAPVVEEVRLGDNLPEELEQIEGEATSVDDNEGDGDSSEVNSRVDGETEDEESAAEEEAAGDSPNCTLEEPIEAAVSRGAELRV